MSMYNRRMSIRGLIFTLFLLFPADTALLAQESQETDLDAQTGSGQSSNFTDYLNAEDEPREKYGFTLFEDPSGMKLDIGGSENEAAAFRVPID